MKISIITATFNSSKTIEDCLNSVSEQTHPDVEHIVIDGGSKDGTIEIVRKYPKVKWISEKDNGLYDAMNKGIKMATGEVIGILNSDDFYSDILTLSKVVGIFNSNIIDAAYGDLEYISKSDKSNIVRRWKSPDWDLGINFKKWWLIPHPALFVRKAVYSKYGGYDTNFKLTADYEYIIRVLRNENIRLFHIPHALVKMRTGGASHKNIFRANYEFMNVNKKNNISFGFLLVVRKLFDKLIQMF
ncbi:MAG: hypothetical protein A2452_13535 [Candidatus Firestonebacteria bacterium RIFOXYC2_FULL_39_67]|nr:MAG: hypothetical protein A2452_13535 [Candidatus Firestonebacteria bacterium RIFOXYC2_FULL_39_67]OGF57308.1 MAG: hypothetical protein A2497_03765 [Candidatus Firestonebacteria bacterium RifOxyC12_full_39_7]